MKDYGFRFVEASANSPVVAAYILKHLVDHGYPLDTKPAADHWVAIVKADEQGVDRVYGVFGWKQFPDFVEISDFYPHESRWGVLAGYAAMAYIKEASDESGTSILTATPVNNTSMIHAYKKFFGVTTPTLVVYRYDPPKIEQSIPMKEAV